MAKKHPPKHPAPQTTVLKGSFKAVGADGAYTFKKFGKAQLVDNRKRDKLSVHLRRLAPKTLYTFALYSVPKGTPRCREGASGGTQETAFPPKSKKTNKRGNLNAKQKSKTFKTDRKKRYFVLVSDGDQVVACAKLDAQGPPRPRRQGQAREHGKQARSTQGKPRRASAASRARRGREKHRPEGEGARSRPKP